MEELNRIAQKVRWSNSTEKETFGDPINYVSFDDFTSSLSEKAKAGISIASSLKEFCIVAVNERIKKPKDVLTEDVIENIFETNGTAMKWAGREYYVYTNEEIDKMKKSLEGKIVPSLNHSNRTNWIYEDQLPEMTDSEYSAWFDLSDIVHGVRMGPPVNRSNPLSKEQIEKEAERAAYWKERCLALEDGVDNASGGHMVEFSKETIEKRRKIWDKYEALKDQEDEKG